MANFGTVLLGTVAATGIGLVGNDDLMDQRLVVLASEECIGGLQTAGFLPLFVNEFEFHHAPAFTAGCTTRSDPFEPGTAPLTNNS